MDKETKVYLAFLTSAGWGTWLYGLQHWPITFLSFVFLGVVLFISSIWFWLK